jgi:hypothetical protein
MGVGEGEVGSRTRTIGAIGVDGVWPAGRYAGANTEVHWECSFRGPCCLRWGSAGRRRRGLRGRRRGLPMRIVRVLGVIVIRGMGDLRVWITVVPRAKLSTAVVIACTFGSCFSYSIRP